jgi:RNA polymerase sigma-70 factor (ECF subfamily)
MNTRTFRALHDACRERVRFGILGYVRNPDQAEDLTADAFATAFERRHTFRGDASFYTWVFGIALNAARSSSRRKRTVSLDAWNAPVPAALTEPDVFDRVLDRADCCQRLRRALKQLPAMYRRALVGHFVRRYPVKEIAKRERIPVGTVLSRIFTGKRLLREAWEE